MRRVVLSAWVFLCVLGLPPPLAGGQEADLSAQVKALQSRLQAMGHQNPTRQEWNDLLFDLDQVLARIDRADQPEQGIQINLLQASVHADAWKDTARAAAILEATLEKYGALSLPILRRVYERLAELYARQGDEEAVRALIKEYKRSPLYDPEDYAYSGGSGRDVPLSVTRPRAGAGASVTVTAMETQRERARLAPGRRFPDFEAVDSAGIPVRLADYRGKVVLLDFWVRDWYVWRRHLPRLVETYRRYHPEGLDILGICLDPDPAGTDKFLLDQGITWRQIVGDRELPRRFGFYGEAANILLGRDGVIVGRDLEGADLVAAIQGAL